jgi:hypothetical protein
MLFCDHPSYVLDIKYGNIQMGKQSNFYLIEFSYLKKKYVKIFCTLNFSSGSFLIVRIWIRILIRIEFLTVTFPTVLLIILDVHCTAPLKKLVPVTVHEIFKFIYLFSKLNKYGTF